MSKFLIKPIVLVGMILCKELLKSAFEKKQKRNPRYSLRALSRDSGVDVGIISKALSGKYCPAPETANKLGRALELSEEEGRILLRAVREAKTVREIPQVHASVETCFPKELDLSLFEVISKPHHYALLELTLVNDFRSDVAWIAKRLGITKLETEYAIRRLTQLGLLENRGGKFAKVDKSLTTKDKTKTTAAHRAHQRTLLKVAQEALELVPIEQRSNTGMTMAIDPSKIPAAKQLILEFNRKMCELLETGSREKVYQLSISLFPLEGMLS
ncbi:MAG: TIGR02147 family protein [Oligoflexales bacterium]